MAPASAQPWLQWSWVRDHESKIVSALLQHLALTGIAVGIGFVISLGLALVAWYWPRWEKPIYGFAGVLYTIPSLALFGFLIPITGLGAVTAEIGLVSYTLLIMIRNTVTALRDVPAEVRDAARGLGYTPTRQLIGVELPLAAPTIIAGVRLAVVTTIGLVAIASYVGAGGGLGALINEGFVIFQNFRTEIVVGAVLSIVLAAALDLLLIGVERAVTPWTRAGRRPRRVAKMALAGVDT